MSLRGKKVTVHDMTLRDGMHPKRHLMTLEQMIDIATGLDEAGVPLIEVTHGDGWIVVPRDPNFLSALRGRSKRLWLRRHTQVWCLLLSCSVRAELP